MMMLAQQHHHRRQQQHRHRRQAALVSLSNSAVPAIADQLVQQVHPVVTVSMAFLASLVNPEIADRRQAQLQN